MGHGRSRCADQVGVGVGLGLARELGLGLRGRRSKGRCTFARRRWCRGAVRASVQLGRASERLTKGTRRMSCTAQIAGGRAAGAGLGVRGRRAAARRVQAHGSRGVAPERKSQRTMRARATGEARVWPCRVGGRWCERRPAGGFGSAGPALARRAYMQSANGQMRADPACALQCSRRSAPSALIPQTASIGAVDTLACGLLAAGLACGAWRWKRSPRGANGDAIG